MIDWHSHILPGMDDGSRDVEQSLQMLEREASQGVKTVVATPHFYANDESVKSFLERRGKAAEALAGAMPEQSPEIILGAEVRYYQGISRMQELSSLRIEGSKLLLLEMPMTRFTEYMTRELAELSGKGGVRIVLAHVERYFGIQRSSIWEKLFECGILMQVNASYFTSFASKRKAVSLLREGRIQFLGSDCHNTTSRPPNISSAAEVIRKKLGTEYLEQINEYGYSKLGKK